MRPCLRECGRTCFGKCEIDASYDTSFDTIFQLHKFDAILKGIKEGLLFVTPYTGMLRHFIFRKAGWYELRDIPKSEMLMIGDASGKPNDFSDSDKKTAENFEIDYLDVNDMVEWFNYNNKD